MKDNWRSLPLEHLYLEPSRNGLNRPKRVRGSGYQMVNMGELFAFDRIANPSMERVQMTEAETERFSLRPGDLLFARQSLVLESAGKCSVVLTTPETTTFESHLIRVRLEPSKAAPVFYYYYFRSPTGKGGIRSLVNQVAAAGIRGSELAKLDVLCPPLTVQHKIAAVLSAYDDTIENNTRRIQILEEMAQVLYREWFVHFRFLGHEQNKTVASEMGPIPDGSEAVAFTEVSEVLSGGTPQTANADYWDGDIPFFTPKDVAGSFYVFETKRAITELGLSKYSSRLYGSDTIFITARGTVGQVVMPGVPMAMSQSSYALKSRLGDYPLFLFMQTRDCVDMLKQNAHGAVFDTIIVNTFRKLKVVRPDIGIVRQFEATAQPFFDQMKTLLGKNINLRHTRDLLLPKLISGGVAVDDLEIGMGD